MSLVPLMGNMVCGAIHFLVSSFTSAFRPHDFFREAQAVGFVERCLACEAGRVATRGGEPLLPRPRLRAHS
jgi:hypothetical protein